MDHPMDSCTVADWPSPEEPPLSPTTRFVAAYAPAPARFGPEHRDTDLSLSRSNATDRVAWVQAVRLLHASSVDQIVLYGSGRRFGHSDSCLEQDF